MGKTISSLCQSWNASILRVKDGYRKSSTLVAINHYPHYHPKFPCEPQTLLFLRSFGYPTIKEFTPTTSLHIIPNLMSFPHFSVPSHFPPFPLGSKAKPLNLLEVVYPATFMPLGFLLLLQGNSQDTFSNKELLLEKC